MPSGLLPTSRGGTTLTEIVQGADAVVLGRVEAGAPFEHAFTRHSLRVARVWKGQIARGDLLSVLQDGALPAGGPPLLEVGRVYILFLEARPRGLWRLTSEYGYGVVEAGQVRSARFLPTAQFWQWQGQPLAEADALLQRVTVAP